MQLEVAEAARRDQVGAGLGVAEDPLRERPLARALAEGLPLAERGPAKQGDRRTQTTGVVRRSVGARTPRNSNGLPLPKETVPLIESPTTRPTKVLSPSASFHCGGITKRNSPVAGVNSALAIGRALPASSITSPTSMLRPLCRISSHAEVCRPGTATVMSQRPISGARDWAASGATASVAARISSVGRVIESLVSCRGRLP